MIADIDFGDVLWGLLLVYLMVMYFVLVFAVLFDLFRDDEVSGVRKAIWTVALLLLPFVALIVYLILRGSGMGKRSAARAQHEKAETDEYMRVLTSASGGLASELEKAKTMHDAGKITDGEYEALKAKLLA